MGLLSHITQMNAHKGGLLRRAELLEKSLSENIPNDSNGIDFYVWASSHGLHRCGIYCPHGEFYYLKHCKGMDLISIENSFSTKDFWEGTVKDSPDWSFYENEELTPFFQLFSKNLRDSISKISVLPFKKDGNINYFLTWDDFSPDSVNTDEFKYELSGCVNGINNTEKSYNLNDGFAISSANMFIVSAKLSMENAFNNLEKNTKEELKKVAMEQLFYLFKKYFASPNCCAQGTNEEIKAVVFSKEEIDEKFLEFHLNTTTSLFFGNSGTSNLLVLSAGICPNQKGTIAFLNQD
jgi:hypothetical protein